MGTCTYEEGINLNSKRKVHFVKKGDYLFHKGEPGDHLICLSAGLVKVVKDAPNNHKQIIRVAKAGDIMGLRAVITGENHNTDAIALEDCRFCLIEKEAIFELIRINPEFSIESIRFVSGIMEETFDQVTKLAYKPVRGRIAESLLLLHNAYSDANNAEGIIHMQRKDLASFSGTVKETLLRTLKEFRDEGLIVSQGTDILIKDKEGLIAISALYD